MFYSYSKSDQENCAKNDQVILEYAWNAYERYLDSVRCCASEFEIAQQKDFAEGFVKGYVKGFAEGYAEGRLKKQLAIAKNFLDVLDAKTIAKITGLTLEQVEALKTE
jgi:flagellar biosynthesis/type III secretory pathway protein FliH